MKTIQRYEIRARRVELAAEEPTIYGEQVTAPTIAAQLARRILAGEAQEVFVALLLTIRNKVTGYVEVARGGQDQCMVDPRVLFRAALLGGACSIILAHNHPSGDPSPSHDDDMLTKRLAQTGAMLGVKVLDHVIVAEDGMYSYAELGTRYLL